jgi:serine/threonine protein kinase
MIENCGVPWSTCDSGFDEIMNMQENEDLRDAYEIVRMLGQGATGTVWEAYRSCDHVRVALIIPHAAFRGRWTDSPSRMRELVLARTLDHPNIVRMLDGQERLVGTGVIEMEYVDGVSLAEHVTRSDHGVLA